MREIKFRAWDKYNSKMLYVFDWRRWGDEAWVNDKSRDEEENPHGSVIHFKPEINENEVGFGYLMQYTGLKDRNGVEIYEGDIVSLPTNHKPYPVVIEPIGVGLRDKNNVWQGSIAHRQFELEIIDNIYENKDLLK